VAENKAKKEKPESGQRIRKRICSVAIVILTFAICGYCLFKTGVLNFQTVDEQLAAIEAARAIPDAENAAVTYYQLLENYDLSMFSPHFMDDDLDSLTIDEPWLSKDYPELAEWLKDRQDTISTLLRASQKEKCRFPIITDFQKKVKYLTAMRGWARLLVRAVNNDIAEGRTDTGIQKCQCLVQMGNHLCQQPVLLDYLVGITIEDLALTSMKTIILEGDLSEKHLKNIEAAIPQTKDNWAEVSSKIIELESLFERKNFSLFDMARYWWYRQKSRFKEDFYDRFQEIYLRQLADRRGSRILIALRRYRNKNGWWPEKLYDVKSLVPADIFVDPINGGSFVYKLTEENFTIYSKGKNNIDDGGERNQSGADDWLIWPQRIYKPSSPPTPQLLPLPPPPPPPPPLPRRPKTEIEKADAQQSNTQKDGVK
jgi:hypothetical protein